MKVSQNTINLQEHGTEVLPEEEATSTKPVTEGTEDPLSIINSTHHNQGNTQPYPRNYQQIVHFLKPIKKIIQILGLFSLFYLGDMNKSLSINSFFLFALNVSIFQCVQASR